MEKTRKTLYFFGRFLAALLILCLSLPSSTSALRPTGLEESGHTRRAILEALGVGLEEGTAERVAEKARDLAGRIRDVLEKVKEPLNTLIDFQPLGDSHDAYRKSLVDQIREKRDDIQRIKSDAAGQGAQSEDIADKVFPVVIAGEVNNEILAPFFLAVGRLETAMKQGTGITDERLNEFKFSLDKSLNLIKRFSQKPGEELIADARKTWEIVYPTKPFPMETETTAGLEEGPLTVEEVRAAAQRFRQDFSPQFKTISEGLQWLSTQRNQVGQGAADEDFVRVINGIEQSVQTIGQGVRERLDASSGYLRILWGTVYRQIGNPLQILLTSTALYSNGSQQGPQEALEGWFTLMISSFYETGLILDKMGSLEDLRVRVDHGAAFFLTPDSSLATLPTGADRVFLVDVSREELILRPYQDIVGWRRYEKGLQRYFEKANEDFRRAGVKIQFAPPEQFYIEEGKSPGQYDFLIYDGELDEQMTQSGYRSFPVKDILDRRGIPASLLAAMILNPSLDLELFRGLKVERITLFEEQGYLAIFARERSA